MRNALSATFATVMIFCIQAAAIDGKHINGFSVSVCSRSPITPAFQWMPDGGWPRGPLVRFDIQNGASVKCDTVFKDLAQYPAISFDGSKVAFFRWGMRIVNNQAVDTGAQCYVSMINKDGTGLINLVPINKPLEWNTVPGFSDYCFETPLLDWPAGEWVYYEKPLKTGEIWKVNINNPSKNQLVVKYNLHPSRASDVQVFLRRWDMSADAAWASTHLCNYAGNANIAHCFPPANGDILACSPGNGDNSSQLPGCNMGMSTGGNYAAHLLYEGHSESFIYKWNHGANGGSWASAGSVTYANIASWSSFNYNPSGSEFNRWAANSEKWLIRRLDGGASNQCCINWIDKVVIVTTRNPVSGGAWRSNDAGDLWVADGPANSWEDVSGAWHAVALPVSATARAGIARVPRNLKADAYDIRGRLLATVSGSQGTGRFGIRVVRIRGSEDDAGSLLRILIPRNRE